MKTPKRMLLVLPAVILMLSGNQLYSQQKSDQPKVKSITVYDEKYDNLISKKTKESEVTYDAHGNILEEIEYSGNKATRHFQYQYDSSDNKIKEIEFDNAGKVSKTSEYKFEKGLRVEKTIYGPDGKLKTKKTYVYTTF